ncbi:hypothetical protein V5799_027183 [Amblyomma americanum]|uniref:Uncharacterized protein n=1 Tax=Amblyomma americanum TaxID=6943 RepID=A0AAQ4DGG1_AMBAM
MAPNERAERRADGRSPRGFPEGVVLHFRRGGARIRSAGGCSSERHLRVAAPTPREETWALCHVVWEERLPPAPGLRPRLFSVDE